MYCSMVKYESTKTNKCQIPMIQSIFDVRKNIEPARVDDNEHIKRAKL